MTTTYSIIFYFIFSLLIFFVGLLGLVIAKKNNFILLISVEIMFIAVNINFIFTSLYLDDIFGMTMVIFLLAVSGGEIALGLAVFILLHRLRNITTSSLSINLKT